ncbi:hypothetical protein [Caldovatus aquaticus]|uniref:Uncharacterized protein n=1 Tax=Caldovatus aquaticus TaxID=2865671 RepID=A0ABS7EY76_9PROT|nr:hypothetical protein [Caldovatus aquaticus]MBW8268301.1 hypothetical protein [Caldovatus aquaticus]
MTDTYALVQEQIDALVHDLTAALRERNGLPWGSPQRAAVQARVEELSRKIEWLLGMPPDDDGPAAPGLPSGSPGDPDGDPPALPAAA